MDLQVKLNSWWFQGHVHIALSVAKWKWLVVALLQYVFKHANLAFSLSILWRNPIQSHHFISHPTQGQPGAAICWNIVNLEPLNFSLVSYHHYGCSEEASENWLKGKFGFLQNRRELLANLIFHLKTKNNTGFNFLRSQICLHTVRSHNSISIYSQLMKYEWIKSCRI